MCSTREGTPELSQPPHGKLHSRGRPTASGKPSRHTPTMCTRHVSPGSCGTTHRPCGAPTPRTGHQPLGQVEPSCLASTADGSSDLAIIMPDKPPTCCLCSEKANSIFPMVTWAWGLTGRGPITTKCIKMVELLPRGPLGVVACLVGMCTRRGASALVTGRSMNTEKSSRRRTGI